MVDKLRNKGANRGKTQVQLEMERRLNYVQKDPGAPSTDVKMVGERTIYDLTVITGDYEITGIEKKFAFKSKNKANIRLPVVSSGEWRDLEIQKIDDGNPTILPNLSSTLDKIFYNGETLSSLTIDFKYDNVALRYFEDPDDSTVKGWLVV